MTKEDLKSGMIVELRNKNKYIVIKDCNTSLYGHQDFCIIASGEFITGNSYREDLTHNTDNNNDIVKIYTENSDCVINRNTYDMAITNCIWKRIEPKEYTMQEIADKLGVKVEDLRIKK